MAKHVLQIQREWETGRARERDRHGRERQGKKQREKGGEREGGREGRERERGASPRCIFLVLSILSGLGRAIRWSE